MSLRLRSGQAPTSRFIASFPLDRAGRLRRDVVDDAVDAGDFVDDAVGDAGEHVVGQAGPVGRHGVVGGDGAERDDVAVGAEVAHARRRVRVSVSTAKACQRSW